MTERYRLEIEFDHEPAHIFGPDQEISPLRDDRDMLVEPRAEDDPLVTVAPGNPELARDVAAFLEFRHNNKALIVGEREQGAILSGLRLLELQAESGYDEQTWLDIASQNGAFEPLSATEIRALCDGLEAVTPQPTPSVSRDAHALIVHLIGEVATQLRVKDSEYLEKRDATPNDHAGPNYAKRSRLEAVAGAYRHAAQLVDALTAKIVKAAAAGA